MKLLRRNHAPPTFRERVLDRIPLEQMRERIPLEQIKDRIPFTIVMKQPPPSRMRRAAPLVAAGVAGAAMAFVFDPERGRERRAKAREMLHLNSDGNEGNGEFVQRLPERQVSAR
ncbi:MAG: hypothetical protein ACRDKG_06115 [Actinomycetota bacterium]